jgi:hypothetical protein
MNANSIWRPQTDLKGCSGSFSASRDGQKTTQRV